MNKFLLAGGLILALAGASLGQAITFTGDVSADFPMDQIFLDPGGPDVGVPGNLAAAIPGVVSGWDIFAVGYAYDPVTDILYVGIDTYGIAGDADGNGDPNTTHPAVIANGGMDTANFAGTESFTFGLDLDEDGILDIVAGIPAGSDFSGFTVARFDATVFFPGQNVLSDPYLRFGAPLPANTGPAPAMPTAGAGDLEFTIPNFSDLLAEFSSPGQTDFGLHVFLGSLEDDGIGEDYLPAIATIDVALPDCAPIPENWTVGDVDVQMNGDALYPTTFGLRDGYGCCTLFSLFLNPVPFPIVSVPAMPVVGLGMFGVPDSIIAIDNGVPASTGNTVNCKIGEINIPAGLLPSGTMVHTQIFEYFTDYSMDFYTSNIVTIVVP